MPTEVEKHLIEAEKEIKKLLDKREKNVFQRTKHHRKALIDFLSGKPVSIRTKALKEESEAYSKSSELNWNYVQGEKLALHDKQPQDVFVDTWLKESICRLNKTIAKQPDLADEVIHRMRGVLLEANYSGLVRANEIFYDWLSGRTPMPLGKNGEHITIHLIDFDNPGNNHFFISRKVQFSGSRDAYFDMVLFS